MVAQKSYNSYSNGPLGQNVGRGMEVVREREGGRMGEGRGGSRREMLGKDDDELLTIMA